MIELFAENISENLIDVIVNVKKWNDLGRESML